MEIVKTLNNGTRVYNLNEIVEKDFDEALKIIEDGMFARSFCPEYIYNERVHNNFCSIYEVFITDESAYNDFVSLLMTVEGMIDHGISFDSWKDNKVEIDGRSMRVGKYMKRKGYDQSIIDYYSSQVRSGVQRYYLTISDLPQHIVGMSYNSDIFHSCMDIEHKESIRLAGSLHDDHLLVAYLHRNIEDLNDMKGNLLARCVMRITDIEGYGTHLIPSKYYGNHETQAFLHRALSMLDEVNIHSRNVRKSNNDNRLFVRNEANGCAAFTEELDEWYEYEEDREEVIDCPKCNGDGKIDYYVARYDRETVITCPICEGNGEYEIEYEIERSCEIPIKIDHKILPYTDDYEHTGDETVIDVNEKYLDEHKEKWKA